MLSGSSFISWETAVLPYAVRNHYDLATFMVWCGGENEWGSLRKGGRPTDPNEQTWREKSKIVCTCSAINPHERLRTHYVYPTGQVFACTRVCVHALCACACVCSSMFQSEATISMRKRKLGVILSMMKRKLGVNHPPLWVVGWLGENGGTGRANLV